MNELALYTAKASDATLLTAEGEISFICTEKATGDFTFGLGGRGRRREIWRKTLTVLLATARKKI